MLPKLFITEGHPRGFASNIICLLGALKKFPESTIVPVPPFLSLYSDNPLNSWAEYFTPNYNSRISLYNPLLDKPTKASIIQFSDCFPLPSYEEDSLSKGNASRLAIEKLSVEFNKNLQLRPEVLSQILQNYSLSSKKSYLSIHRRMTDHAMHTEILSNHSFSLSIEKYMLGHRNVFLATDDISFIAWFKNRFNNINLLYNDVERTDGSVGIHFKPASSSTKIKRGLDILADIIAMSYSKYLLCGASGIPVLAKIINPSMNMINVTNLPWK